MTPLKYQSSKNVNETEIQEYSIQECARHEVNAAVSGVSKDILVQLQASFLEVLFEIQQCKIIRFRIETEYVSDKANPRPTLSFSNSIAK